MKAKPKTESLTKKMQKKDSPKTKTLIVKNKIIAKTKKKKRTKPASFFAGGCLLVLVSVFILFSRQEVSVSDSLLIAPQTRDIASSVLLSGKVISDDSADLGFAQSGRIGEFRVSEGQNVQKGEILARLDVADIAAQIKQAIANYQQVQAQKDEVVRGSDNQTSQKFDLAQDSAQSYLQEVITQQESLVESAYKVLLTTGLEAAPEDLTTSAIPPSVSGYLRDFTEGEIKMEIYSSAADSGSSIRFSGPASGTQSLSFAQSIPIGDSGLFATFDSSSRYSATTWTISIPNDRSSSYSTNLAAYNAALKTRDVAIASAKNSLTSASSENKIDDAGSTSEAIAAVNARLSAASAEIDLLRARRENYSIIAPFSGIISSVDKSVGETVISGEEVISMLKNSDLSVEVDIPELDIGLVSVGSKAMIQLDAYKEQQFEGSLSGIEPAESVRDGVVVYKALLEFQQQDDSRILSGMTARATINTGEKQSVTALPLYSLEKIRTETENFYCAAVLSDGEIDFKKIVLGLMGSDGFSEVVSGVTLADVIIDPEYFDEKNSSLEKQCKSHFEIA